jgi:SAM-dependent methyltransferase
MDWLALIARWSLALVLCAAATGKLLDRQSWQQALTGYRVAKSALAPVGLVLPLLEFGAAVLLAYRPTARWGALLALVATGVFLAIVRLGSRRLERSASLRYGLLFLAAVVVLWQGGATPAFHALIEQAGFTPAVWAAVILAGLALALVLVQGWFVVNLLAQQGRVLVHLENVQKALRIMPDIIYLPISRHALDSLVRLADFTSSDTVYDLGCGDGRIVVAAAERGAHAVGVDIDPVRIQEARANAEAESQKLTGKVEFLIQSLFEVDISSATVVTLYLGKEINEKLRPRLLRDLRPGARVLSHAFTMGDWEPDRTNDDDRIYLWVIPAHVSGDWSWELPDGRRATAHLEQSYQKISGVLTLDQDTISIPRATLSGQEITLVLRIGEEELTYRGQVTGNSIAGRVQRADGTSAGWIARRAPAHAGADPKADPFSGARTDPTGDRARVGL